MWPSASTAPVKVSFWISSVRLDIGDDSAAGEDCSFIVEAPMRAKWTRRRHAGRRQQFQWAALDIVVGLKKLSVAIPMFMYQPSCASVSKPGESATVEKPVVTSSSTSAVWNIRLNGQMAVVASGIGRSRYALKVASVFQSLPSWSYWSDAVMNHPSESMYKTRFGIDRLAPSAEVCFASASMTYRRRISQFSGQMVRPPSVGQALAGEFAALTTASIGFSPSSL